MTHSSPENETAPRFYIVNQHIGWLKQYILGMDKKNWRDMQLRAERQLESLSEEIDKEEAALGIRAQSAPKPYGEVLDEMDHEAKYQPGAASVTSETLAQFLHENQPIMLGGRSQPLSVYQEFSRLIMSEFNIRPKSAFTSPEQPTELDLRRVLHNVGKNAVSPEMRAAIQPQIMRDADTRWAVNVLLEKIASKFEDWETLDLWRSEAASTVRSFKHDLALTRPEYGDAT